MTGSAAPPSKRLRVAIIGSGITGISAAYKLFKHNQSINQSNDQSNNQSNEQLIDFVVYEKSDSIGGHAHTHSVPINKSSNNQSNDQSNNQPEIQQSDNSNNQSTNQSGNQSNDQPTNQLNVDCDVGFMVLNAVNYPNLISFFDENNVELEKSDMSLSVSISQSNDQSIDQFIEWSSENLFAQKFQLINPKFYLMLADVIRFKKDVLSFLEKIESANPADQPEDSKQSTEFHAEQEPSAPELTKRGLNELTLGEFLIQNNYSNYFIDYYLIPVCASVWSLPRQSALDVPAIFILSFMRNHHLLQLTNRPQWLTVKGRTKQGYVEKVVEPFKHCFQLNAQVTSVKAIKGFNRSAVEISLASGETSEFDAVIFASHAPDSLAMLGANSSPKQREILEAIQYQPNDVVLHTDESMMPKRRSCWTAWNFIGAQSQADEKSPVKLTYYLNRLQNLQTDQNIFVTLNPPSTIDQSKIISRWVMDHPMPSINSVHAVARLDEIQGVDGMYFAGAWAGWGFHEDGCKSGFSAAHSLLSKQVWTSNSLDAKDYCFVAPTSPVSLKDSGKLVTFPDSVDKHETSLAGLQSSVVDSECPSPAVTEPQFKLLPNPKSFNERAPMFSVAYFARLLVHRFLKAFIHKGRITLREDGGSVGDFGSSDVRQSSDSVADGPASGYENNFHATIQIHNPEFYVKIASSADLGLADAYIDGDFSCESMVELFQLFVVNRDVNQAANGNRLKLSVLGLFTSTVQTSFAAIAQAYIKRNTPTQARANISEHYDTGNEFFRLFLDSSMTYSCAIFRTPEDSLYQAQVNKVEALVERLDIQPFHSVLEIGSGWGFLSRFIARRYGCRVTAITLSHEQLDMCRQLAKEEKLDHLCKYELVDYRVFGQNNASVKFDRIVSCEMLEAVGHDYFGEFYSNCDRLLAKNGLMSIQFIAFPDNKYDEYRANTDFIRERIFPGGLCPSLSALTQAMSKHSSLLLEHVSNIGPHYAPTLEMWRRNLKGAPQHMKDALRLTDPILRKWDYYFAYCEAGFRMRSLNVYHLLYTRASNLNLDSYILLGSAAGRRTG